jgi:hypothetical protein
LLAHPASARADYIGAFLLDGIQSFFGSSSISVGEK